MLERARAEIRGEQQLAQEEIRTSATGAVAAAKPRVVRPGTGLASRRLPTATELNAEYAYVTKDLRNLLVLAGLLFAFIVVAAVLLPPIQL